MSLFADRVRAEGYVDGLRGRESRRLAHHPRDRFTYQAGFQDGLYARQMRDPRAEG